MSLCKSVSHKTEAHRAVGCEAVGYVAVGPKADCIQQLVL